MEDHLKVQLFMDPQPPKILSSRQRPT